MNKKTLTIFFCGTASNHLDYANPSYHNGELVATLANSMAKYKKEFVDWVVVDGPGSGNLQEDENWTKPGGYHRYQGNILGDGWEENVSHAAAILKGKAEWRRQKLTANEYSKLQKHLGKEKFPNNFSWFERTTYPDRKVAPQDLQEKIVEIFRGQSTPEVVNLIGWSRGAISCHMFADFLAKDENQATRNIKLNIFGIDPVPGPGKFQAHRVALPANVHHFVGIYARDDRQVGFSPLIPSLQSSHTKVTILPFFGGHSTLVGNATDENLKEKEELRASGELVRDLAEKYLKYWGADFRLTCNYNRNTILEKYENMLKNNQYYKALRRRSCTYVTNSAEKDRLVWVEKEGVWKNFSDAVRLITEDYRDLSNIGPYVNWHHYLLAKNSKIKDNDVLDIMVLS